MVRQLRVETGLRHGTSKRVADQLGCGVEPLRGWVTRDEIDNGESAGTTSAEGARLRELEAENRDFRRSRHRILEIDENRVGTSQHRLEDAVWSITRNVEELTK